MFVLYSNTLQFAGESLKEKNGFNIYCSNIMYILEIINQCNGTHSYQRNENTSMKNIYTIFYKKNIFFLSKSDKMTIDIAGRSHIKVFI